MLATVGARWVLIDIDGRDDIAWPVDVVPVVLAEAAEEQPAAVPVRLDLEQPAYVLFTSDSTGEPKVVEVPHRAAMNTIDDLTKRFELRSTDRALGISALDFDLSVFDIFAPFSVGGAVVVVDQEARRDAQYWVKLIREHHVTVLNCAPALLDMLLSTSADLGTSLRLFGVADDQLSIFELWLFWLVKREVFTVNDDGIAAGTRLSIVVEPGRWPRLVGTSLASVATRLAERASDLVVMLCGARTGRTAAQLLERLTDQAHAHPDPLGRMLRLLVLREVFTEPEPDTLGFTEIGRLLLDDDPSRVRCRDGPNLSLRASLPSVVRCLAWSETRHSDKSGRKYGEACFMVPNSFTLGQDAWIEGCSVVNTGAGWPSWCFWRHCEVHRGVHHSASDRSVQRLTDCDFRSRRDIDSACGRHRRGGVCSGALSARAGPAARGRWPANSSGGDSMRRALAGLDRLNFGLSGGRRLADRCCHPCRSHPLRAYCGGRCSKRNRARSGACRTRRRHVDNAACWLASESQTVSRTPKEL